MTTQFNARLPKPTIKRIKQLAKDYGSDAKVIMAAVELLHTKEAKMSNKTYKINYHTGAGDTEFTGDILLAMATADSGAVYTQQPITIEDEDGNEVARRQWYGVLTGIEDCQNPIQFGDFGYYADWIEE